MKLLGQFNRNVGLQYQNLLEGEGIAVAVEDWSNSYELTAGFALVRLLVTDQDYEKSVNLIKDYEDKVSQRIAKSADKIVNKELLKAAIGILIRVVVLLVVIALLFLIFGYYNYYNALKLDNEGFAELNRGHFTQALQDYNKSIEMMPHHERTYVNRGITYGKLGNLSQSISDFTTAIEINPQDPNTYFNRGTSYYSEHKYPEAIVDFSKAIELSPQNAHARADSYESRAYVYFDNKEYDKAWADVHKADALGYKPDNEDVDFLSKLKKASGQNQ